MQSRQDTAMPFTISKRKQEVLTRSHKGLQLGKEPKRSFDKQILFCHIVMTLKKVYFDKQECLLC